MVLFLMEHIQKGEKGLKTKNPTFENIEFIECILIIN